MSEQFYDAIAEWYDLEFADFTADLDLYLGYAGIVGGPILELGCGTGRLLAPLADAGYQVIGVDSSPAMIERARERLATARVDNARVGLADIRTLEGIPQGMRLVFSAINSFLHLLTREDQLAALRSARRVLDGDGILVLDVFHPAPGTLQAMDDRFAVDGQWTLPDGTVLDRFSHRRVRPAEQLVETMLYFDRTGADGAVHRVTARYVMRYIHRFELESLLLQADFALEGIYGGYGLEPFDDHSANLIVVAHRR
jgi:SAM-dependent methyltransferase